MTDTENKKPRLTAAQTAERATDDANRRNKLIELRGKKQIIQQKISDIKTSEMDPIDREIAKVQRDFDTKWKPANDAEGQPMNLPGTEDVVVGVEVETELDDDADSIPAHLRKPVTTGLAG